MAQKTLVGNVAQVYVDNKLVGIFDNINWSTSIGTEEIFVLGKETAAEIAITHQNTVSVSCSGFQVAGNGPYNGSASAKTSGNSKPKVPLVQDLLSFEPFTIAVVNRQSGALIVAIKSCTPTSHSGSANARATSKVSITYTGIIMQDDSGDQSDSAKATTYP